MTNTTTRLVAHTLIAFGLSGTAAAQPPSEPQFATEIRTWNIPAEMAATAIRDFGLQSGISVFADFGQIEGKRFNPVVGPRSVDEALTQLLAGTGLEYKYIADHRAVSFTIQPKRNVARSTRERLAELKSQVMSAPILLEEIVVTAERREERLHDVPLSVQVVQGQTLAQRNLNSLNDVSEIMPSVHIGANGRSANLYIRGIGSGENQSFDQSVGIFSDDVYHGRARLSGATLLDLDRIEVLKGPQSTFFGNNAIAGAYNIVTKKPGGEFEASMRGLYGEHGDYAAEGAIGGPIGHTFAVRIAASLNGTAGWLRNEGIGRNIPGENSIAGRVSLRFTPFDELDVTLKAEGSKLRNSGSLGYQTASCPPPAPLVAAGFCQVALGLGVPGGLNNNSVSQNSQGAILNTTEYVLTAHYNKWRHTLTSVSSYYEYRYSADLDTDGLPLTLLNGQVPEDFHQISQEFRIASPAAQRIEYLGGLYFHVSHLRFEQASSYFFLTPTLSSAPPFAPLTPYLPLGQDIRFSQPERTYSAFGSAVWNVTDSLKLGMGLRASWVWKRYDWSLSYATASEPYGGMVPLPAAQAALAQTFANAVGLGVANTLRGSRDDRALIPSALAQYSVTRDVMTYLSYTKGFKAGGFNGADVTGTASSLLFAPEHVDAYQGGLKTKWFDHTVLLNLALFRSDYKDLQVATNLNSGTTFYSLVRNAASSRTQGIELESAWVPNQHIHLAVSATYDAARYIRYPNVTPNPFQQFSGQTVQDLSGRPTEYAPDWSGTLTASYASHVFGPFQLTTEVSTMFSSSYFLDGNDNPLLRQGSYARLDARLSLETTNQSWALDLIAKNLTDRNILIFGTEWPTSLGSTLAAKEQTRNVAIQARFLW